MTGGYRAADLGRAIIPCESAAWAMRGQTHLLREEWAFRSRSEMYQNRNDAALRSNNVEPAPNERPAVRPWHEADGTPGRGGRGAISGPGRPPSELSRTGARRRSAGAG